MNACLLTLLVSIGFPPEEAATFKDIRIHQTGGFAGVDSIAILLAEPEEDAFAIRYGWNHGDFDAAFDWAEPGSLLTSAPVWRSRTYTSVMPLVSSGSRATSVVNAT